MSEEKITVCEGWVDYRDRIIKLFTLYLEKHDQLSQEEKDEYVKLFSFLGKETVVLEDNLDLAELERLTKEKTD